MNQQENSGRSLLADLPGSKYLVAFSSAMAIEPALTAEEVTAVFNSVRASHPEISNFAKDDDGVTQRINNGPDVTAKKEIYVKSVRGEELQVAWGPEATNGMSVLSGMLRDRAETLTPFRITGFDHNLRFDIPYRGNHYEVFSDLYYSKVTVGRLYQALASIGARVLDNDIRLLLTTDSDEVVVVNLSGRTSRSEAASREYEEKDIRVFIGIHMSKPSLLQTSLTIAVPEHVAKVQETIKKHVAPAILQPLMDRVLEGGSA